jgi:hypothetical protein
VTRKITLRELEALFARHDFNAFPVVEEGSLIGLPQDLRLHDQSDGAAL